MDNKNKQIDETDDLAIAKDPPSSSSDNEIPENSREAFASSSAASTRGPAVEQPPYPWAGERRCRVCTLTYLHSKKIEYISGEVHCQKCDTTYEMHYNVGEKFNEITYHRAHKEWMNPVRLNCHLCKEEKSVSPVIPENKQNINWLFLLLGQMLGFCSLQQLKYFCKHTANNLTGGKHALLRRVYLDLCRQVDPTDGFSL